MDCRQERKFSNISVAILMTCIFTAIMMVFALTLAITKNGRATSTCLDERIYILEDGDGWQRAKKYCAEERVETPDGETIIKRSLENGEVNSE